MILADVAAVSRLIRDSFSAEVRSFMTYTQHGIAAFLSVPLKYPEADPDRHFLVALDAGRPQVIAGFAEFRVVAGKVGFLSYVCVAELFRGRGVARTLLSSFRKENQELQGLQLDVFRDNSPAKSLYRKLGFETESAVAWVTRSTPRPSGFVKIRALPMAIASHSVYGFCEMAVVNESGETRIGLIGGEVLRCFAFESFIDDVLLSGVSRLFPSVRTALAILPVDTLSDISTSHRVINYSDRMYLSRDGLSAL
ncbi:N-acetyltransferase family protein [Pseudarthrobacter sp. Y6]|uniref:GNAT family N-acetyltransferase n=1 Tax=Pseudarthrobacter sp. Y6 TaxID=3418422 RepID=UPI003CEACF56